MMTIRPSAGARVLIIDDDEGLNALLTEYLGRFGFSVRTVNHPDAGLRALTVDPPDLSFSMSCSRRWMVSRSAARFAKSLRIP